MDLAALWLHRSKKVCVGITNWGISRGPVIEKVMRNGRAIFRDFCEGRSRLPYRASPTFQVFRYHSLPQNLLLWMNALAIRQIFLIRFQMMLLQVLRISTIWYTKPLLYPLSRSVYIFKGNSLTVKVLCRSQTISQVRQV